MGKNYEGPVIFGHDGQHYPVGKDGEPDFSRPLRWVEGTTYRDAEEGEALHNDVHHQNDSTLEVGGDG